MMLRLLVTATSPGQVAAGTKGLERELHAAQPSGEVQAAARAHVQGHAFERAVAEASGDRERLVGEPVGGGPPPQIVERRRHARERACEVRLVAELGEQRHRALGVRARVERQDHAVLRPGEMQETERDAPLVARTTGERDRGFEGEPGHVDATRHEVHPRPRDLRAHLQVGPAASLGQGPHRVRVGARGVAVALRHPALHAQLETRPAARRPRAGPARRRRRRARWRGRGGRPGPPPAPRREALRDGAPARRSRRTTARGLRGRAASLRRLRAHGLLVRQCGEPADTAGGRMLPTNAP